MTQKKDQVVAKVKGNFWPGEQMKRFKYLLTRLEDVVLAVNVIGKWVKVDPEPLQSC
jgi:hypothetical protein